MSKKKLQESSSLLRLRVEIEKWRRNKSSRKMPEGLWGQAVEEAQIHGASATSHFLKIAYADLIKRGAVRRPGQLERVRTVGGFLELPQVPIEPRSSMEVSLICPDGQTVIVKGIASSANWESLFSGWLKASRSIQQGRVS